MKKVKSLLILMCCIGTLSLAVKSQTNVQTVFDSLVPRRMNLEQIEKILGKADSETKIYQTMGKLQKDGAFHGYEYENTECRHDITSSFIKRNVYRLNYPALGLSLQVFDTPWNLYAVETTNPEISAMNIKVGDSLEKVQSLLGKGDWQATEGSDFWYLAYEKTGIRFIFPRDLSAKQFPRKLAAAKTVTQIIIFDRKTFFVGCAKDQNRHLQ